MVSRVELVMKIKIIVDALKESGYDIVIVTRTYSCQALLYKKLFGDLRLLLMQELMYFSSDALVLKEDIKHFVKSHLEFLKWLVILFLLC